MIPVDPLWIVCIVLAAAAVFFALPRRRPADAKDPAPEAVLRDLSRLVEELRAASREQVARLDREVKRLQAAVAEADRARLALEEVQNRAPARVPAPPPPVERVANPLHRRVFELRDSGKHPADIGVETGLEVGEVELILGLRTLPPRA